MRTRLFASLAVLFVMAACEGPVGPEGPQGPQGPQGIQGPQGVPGVSPNTLSYQGFLDSAGEGGAIFPGASLTRSIVNCWISSDGTTWLQLATDTNGNAGASCGAAQSGSSLVVAVVGGPPRWHFLIVVAVYSASSDREEAQRLANREAERLKRLR